MDGVRWHKGESGAFATQRCRCRRRRRHGQLRFGVNAEVVIRFRRVLQVQVHNVILEILKVDEKTSWSWSWWSEAAEESDSLIA